MLSCALLGQPAQLRHTVFEGSRSNLLGVPSGDQRSDVFRLQAGRVHMPKPHLMELVRN